MATEGITSATGKGEASSVNTVREDAAVKKKKAAKRKSSAEDPAVKVEISKAGAEEARKLQEVSAEAKAAEQGEKAVKRSDLNMDDLVQFYAKQLTKAAEKVKEKSDSSDEQATSERSDKNKPSEQ